VKSAIHPESGRVEPTGLASGEPERHPARVMAPFGPGEQGRRLVLVAGAGALVAGLFISQLYVWINWWPIRIGWGTAAVWALPQLLVWAATIPAMLSLARRWPIEGPDRARRLLAHGGASIGLALLGLVALDVSDRLLHWSQALGAPDTLLSRLKYTIIHLHMGVGVYWVTLAVSHAARYRQGLFETHARAEALAGELAGARLALLRSQLQPHFLFNTLNAIAVSIRHDPAAAETMVHRLADFLRLALEASDLPEVTVREELVATDTYLDIERVRAGARLRATIDTAPDAEECLVPTLILQPLVENAVRYAVATRASGGSIAVRAERLGARLVLTVTDDGPGLGRGGDGAGIGLANVRRRLTTHYGDAASFTLSPGVHGGVEARVELPARLIAPVASESGP
jgi:signal transduction histidine kinase